MSSGIASVGPPIVGIARSMVNLAEQRLLLAPEIGSVRFGRRFVGFCLHEWGTVAQREIATLLTSELVTNAIRHAGPHAPGSELEVVVEHEGRRARVGVRDHIRDVPVVGDGAVGADSGRGMMLVEAMASNWGVEPKGSGKLVWFEMGG